MTDQISFMPFLELTPEQNDDDDDDDDCRGMDESVCNWLDDAECQENLFHIVSLSPEESHIDANNHIKTRVKLFFEELGYLTEEPEPIDPSRDYEAEAQQFKAWRDNKRRAQHIELSCLPSLVSSRSSSASFHPNEPLASDTRIPQFPWECRDHHFHSAIPYHHPFPTIKPTISQPHRHHHHHHNKVD